jgi:cyclic pyranopterin phosphate synthase
VGFISAMSHRFCDTCDRLRIGADGSVFPCLMSPPAGNLTPALRPRFDADRCDQILAAALACKALGHPESGVVPMTVMGG